MQPSGNKSIKLKPSMKVDIIGRGNVAHHLSMAINHYEDFDCRMVNPRSLEGLRRDTDIFLLAVSDDAIAEVSGRLCAMLGPVPESEVDSNQNILQDIPVIAHTSGSTPLSVLAPAQKLGYYIGVFYPLQTFSRDIEMDYVDIPVFIEGDSDYSGKRLAWLACPFGETIMMDSEKRKSLHLASVVACNFTNHLWALADEYLGKEGIDFKLMLPLIRESINKLERVDHPREGQTGPAARRDMQTISRHLEMLESNPDLKNIYQTLTNSIINEVV